MAAGCAHWTPFMSIPMVPTLAGQGSWHQSKTCGPQALFGKDSAEDERHQRCQPCVESMDFSCSWPQLHGRRSPAETGRFIPLT
jgi:hypothetical protein